MAYIVQKATFKLNRLLSGSNLKPEVQLHLFDQLIKIVCTYGSPIWGFDLIKCLSKDKYNESLEKLRSVIPKICTRHS